MVGEQWFLYRADPSRPLTAQSQEGCDPETGNAEAESRGFAVLTQTCDIVRRCDRRPFIEVAPLRELTVGDWRAAARGRLPRYAVIPSLGEQRLAADLDLVMTVEKAVVAGWERVVGCRSDAEVRRFALVLARKRVRFAFPDEFVALVQPLQRRLVQKHDKQSAEGRALRSLRGIRVRAAPSWDASSVGLTFFIIRHSGALDFEGASWSDLMATWLGRLAPAGRYAELSGLVQTLDDLTARDYVESDPLDIEYLSDRPE